MSVVHTYKTRKGHATSSNLSTLQAIKHKCLDCSCWQVVEIQRCMITDCALYPFRFGKNPSLKRVLTEEQRKVNSERLKKYHFTKSDVDSTCGDKKNI